MAIGALVPPIPGLAGGSKNSQPFQWRTEDLVFSFAVRDGMLRQKRLVPSGGVDPELGNSFGVEVALQCSGENSPDQGMKSGVGQPRGPIVV